MTTEFLSIPGKNDNEFVSTMCAKQLVFEDVSE